MFQLGAQTLKKTKQLNNKRKLFMDYVENKKVYRCDSISSVDDFLSAREVLKLEMFGDDNNDGFRNFDGVISDIERLFPDFNLGGLMESFNVEQLEHDVESQYNFTDKVIELLQKDCGAPEELFNYAIWACDTPEEVVESYDVEPEDINCYVIEKGILLQDLGPEGQLYGVAERPECIFEESIKVIKLRESVSDKKEIFEWLPFLEKNYKPLENLTSDDLEIAFNSDHKGEIIKKSENPTVWKSAKIRNEAYIVEKAMDEFQSLTSGLNFKEDFDGSVELVKERAPSKLYLNYLFLKTLGSQAIIFSHKHIKVLSDDIYLKFINKSASSEDRLVGKAILFYYLGFILGKEHFSDLLGLYTLSGAKSDKGVILDRNSRTTLNDVLDQIDSLSFDENDEFIPVLNGEPSPTKTSPFFLLKIGAYSTINNKVGCLSRKSVSSAKKQEKDEDVIAEDSIKSGSHPKITLDDKIEYQDLGSKLYKILSSKTKKITDDPIKARNQAKNGPFAPELSAFIFYAILNPEASVLRSYNSALGIDNKDLHNLTHFGFEDTELRQTFIKFMKLNSLSDYDEEMVSFKNKLLNSLEGLAGKRLDRAPMPKSRRPVGDWLSYQLDTGYVVTNNPIGSYSKKGDVDSRGRYTKGELENIMENKEELFDRIYEECVCAGGASGISGMTPQHMTAVVDTKVGDVSRFTGGNGGRKVKTDKEVLFTNDTMKVHKKRTKKGDAVTGTGVVYANGKLMEAMDKILESFEQEDEPQIPLTETKRAPDGSIESNKEGSVGDWSPLDSQVFAYDLIDAGKADLDERQILKELYDHPYFKDLFDAIEEEETKLGGSTSNTVGWDNVASDEIEHAAKEVYDILQAHEE